MRQCREPHRLGDKPSTDPLIDDLRKCAADWTANWTTQVKRSQAQEQGKGKGKGKDKKKGGAGGGKANPGKDGNDKWEKPPDCTH